MVINKLLEKEIRKIIRKFPPAVDNFYLLVYTREFARIIYVNDIFAKNLAWQFLRGKEKLSSRMTCHINVA